MSKFNPLLPDTTAFQFHPNLNQLHEQSDYRDLFPLLTEVHDLLGGAK